MHFLSALSTACLAPSSSPPVTSSCYQPQSMEHLIPQMDIVEVRMALHDSEKRSEGLGTTTTNEKLTRLRFSSPYLSFPPVSHQVRRLLYPRLSLSSLRPSPEPSRTNYRSSSSPSSSSLFRRSHQSIQLNLPRSPLPRPPQHWKHLQSLAIPFERHGIHLRRRPFSLGLLPRQLPQVQGSRRGEQKPGLALPFFRVTET